MPEPGTSRVRISAADAAQVFQALGQETRLEAFRLLLRYRPYGLAAGDIARLLAVPHNTLSSHLALLQQAGLVVSRREGRSIIFAARADRMALTQAFLAQGVAGPPAIAGGSEYPVKRSEALMSAKVYNVLILCTGNSARSILAEAIVECEGAGRFKAYSAGSQPKGTPNPYAIELLASLGYDTSRFRSKSWTEFGGADAPAMDFIITVCDSAAGESCPYWPGHPFVAHWGIPDPAEITASPEQARAAFQEAYRRLMSRVTAFVNLPIETLSLPELKARLAEIGTMDGATEMALSGAGP